MFNRHLPGQLPSAGLRGAENCEFRTSRIRSSRLSSDGWKRASGINDVP